MIPSPAFVIEEEKFHTNLTRLKEIKESTGIRLLMALKGFALPALMTDILQVADGIAVSSLNEAKLGYIYGGKPVHLYMPAYRPQEIPELIPITSHWTFNSLEAFNQWVPYLPPHLSIGLRINPHYGYASADIYNPGRPGSRLGVPLRGLPDKLPPPISGLHIHTLCEAGAEALEALIQNLVEKFERWLKQITWLNLGGGHLLTHREYDLSKLAKIIQDLRSYFPNLREIYMEPSAAFVWEAGYLLAEVLDITATEGRNWAMLDVSFTAHMPDTLEMPYKPKVREALAEVNLAYPTYWLGGATCLAGDEMGPYSFPTPLEVGMRLTFHDMAHYTFVKTTFFNGAAHPSLVIQNTRGYRVVKTFLFQDYLNRLRNV
ncbi:MAG: carboxynorspermidine decarboxylase [Bacteroidia bacterium]|nr:carboxynorspermidine decarboxylase [Bacteroidia bacterium]MDW8134465.1 carboxynorspermidine decarboxylase [Bacteroidia bacterium]